MSRSFYQRSGRPILLAAAALVPLMLFGAAEALKNKSNSVRQWLPDGFAETRQYDWFVSHFGSEEFALVSWPGATLNDPRLDRFAAGLRAYMVPTSANGESDSIATHADDRYLFREVTTGPQAARELMSAPLSLSASQAVHRLRGSLISTDGETTGVAVMVSEAGIADRHAALETIYRVAHETAGLKAEDLHVGGPTVDSVALDSESERSRYLLAALSIVLAVAVAWRCLGRINLMAAVFVTALFCSASSLAWVHVSGGTMNLIMVTMPTLVFVLAVSGAVHLANYYRDEVAARGQAGAAERAVASAWLPCTLTGVTTAVGLGSLGLSDVEPVRMFGIYSAIGVLTSLPVLFLILPAILSVWPLHPGAVHKLDAANRGMSAGGWGDWLSHRIARHHLLLTAVCLAVMVGAAAGLVQLKSSVKLLNMFSPESRIITDYTWLEENLGPLVPVELIVRLDRDNSLSFLDRLALVAELQDRLKAIPEVGGTMSAATFAPPVPEGGGARQITRRVVMEKKLVAQRERFVQSGYLADEGDRELWRVSARVEALNDLDYGQFIVQLRDQVEPVLDRYRTAERDVDAVYTGVVPLVYKAQRTLLNDLTSSFFAAFGIIAVVMMVTLRGVSAGLLSMLPNAFPAVVIFGGMAWSGRLVDIGSMMTASVAMGIAVDDTIHLLSWFRRGIRRGMSRREAIHFAYRHCAAAMLQTTLICGIGMSAFALSSFVPTSNFAMLMIVMLATALVGDLIFLPALLAGPLGRYFEQPSRVREHSEAAPSAEGVGWRGPHVRRPRRRIGVAAGRLPAASAHRPEPELTATHS